MKKLLINQCVYVYQFYHLLLSIIADPLKKSSLVESNLITAYIPFLALEKSHVKQCVIDSLLSKGYYGQHYQVDMSRVAKVLEELQFDMSFQRISITGCKRVKEKIDYIMQTE